MNKQNGRTTWLESILRRDLERVSAPEELRYRVMFPSAQNRGPEKGSSSWVLAAGLLTASVLALAWTYYPRHASDYEAVAKRELLNTDPPQFACQQPLRAREWIRERTGIDVDLPSRLPDSIQMVGVSIVGSGALIKICFRAAKQDAVLLVSRADQSLFTATHDHQNRNTSAASWTTAGQAYALAVRNDQSMQYACQMCHAEGSI